MRFGLKSLLAVLAVSLLVAGCEGTFGSKKEEPKPEAAVVEGSTGTTAATTEGTGTTTGVESGGAFQGNPLDDPASPLANRTIYFDFDSATIKDEDKAMIEAHAKYLATHSSASITLEGNADERGTREYNAALGERRANVVREMMTLLGASGQQIRTVSYGEERPAAPGHDEAAWRLNRRVDIVYRTR